MTWLLLALTLCWDPNTEPDLSHYLVTSAERHVVRWVDCPCGPPPSQPCTVPPAQCPVYNPFAWQTFSTGLTVSFTRSDCAVPYSVCYFRYPVAVGLAGNQSTQPPVTNFSIVWNGTCP